MAPSRRCYKAAPSFVPAQAAASTFDEDGAPLGFIPEDPKDIRLTVSGAVCGADGKVDIEAYEDIMQCWAGEPPPKNHPDPIHPGVRPGEEVPKGLRVWQGGTGGKAKDSAGWVAATECGGKTKRFNIRTCGSWRLAFLLARIQRAMWHAESDLPPRDVPSVAMSPKKITPIKRLRRQSSAEDTPRKRKLQRRPSDAAQLGDSPTKRAKLMRRPSDEGKMGRPMSKLNNVLARIRARVQSDA